MDPHTDNSPSPQPGRVQRPHPKRVWDGLIDAGVTNVTAHRWVELLIHYALPNGDHFNACSVNLLSPRSLNKTFGLSKNVGATVRDPLLDAGVVVALKRGGRVRVMMHFDARCRNSGPATLDENGVCVVCHASLRHEDDDRYPLGSPAWRSALVLGPNPPAIWPSPVGDTRLQLETDRLQSETERLQLETPSHINDQNGSGTDPGTDHHQRSDDDAQNPDSDINLAWSEAFPDQTVCPAEHRGAVAEDLERYGFDRVAEAARRGNEFHASTWAYVQAILKRDAAREQPDDFATQIEQSRYRHLIRE